MIHRLARAAPDAPLSPEPRGGGTFAERSTSARPSLLRTLANQPTPWAVGTGGPNTAGPGQTIEATVTLDAGNYVLVSFVPSPGSPVAHMAKGMIHALTVSAK